MDDDPDFIRVFTYLTIWRKIQEVIPKNAHEVGDAIRNAFKSYIDNNTDRNVCARITCNYQLARTIINSVAYDNSLVLVDTLYSSPDGLLELLEHNNQVIILYHFHNYAIPKPYEYVISNFERILNSGHNNCIILLTDESFPNYNRLMSTKLYSCIGAALLKHDISEQTIKNVFVKYMV